MTCSKCGSDKIIPGVTVRDQGQHSDGRLKVGIDTTPSAILFKHPINSELRARICGECGYTELYADNPATLYEAYQKTEQ